MAKDGVKSHQQLLHAKISHNNIIKSIILHKVKTK